VPHVCAGIDPVPTHAPGGIVTHCDLVQDAAVLLDRSNRRDIVVVTGQEDTAKTQLLSRNTDSEAQDGRRSAGAVS